MHAGKNWHSKAKDEIVDIYQDYNAVEKWAMIAHLRAAVHANFKNIFRKQKRRKQKELSKKYIN